MKVPVLWCQHTPTNLARGYFDSQMIEAWLDRSVWSPPDPITYEHHEVRGDFPDVPGALVIFNGRTHTSDEDVAWLCESIERLDWSLVMLTGDEEASFPWRKLPTGPNRRLWVMQARPEHECDGYLPGGWYPGTREHLKAAGQRDRTWPFFFAGQVTHERRQACAAALRGRSPSWNGVLIETTRYLEEGIPRDEYFRTMAMAQVIPCPSGPYSVDCARAFEALEAGCVPALDTQTAYAGAFDYWSMIFGEMPAPRITDWSTFSDVLAEQVKAWPWNGLACWARWQQWKREQSHKIDAQLREVAGQPSVSVDPNDTVTAVITTSPAPLHPSTDHIEQVVASIREQLPTAEIVIVADGVRPEQERFRQSYGDYLQRLLWLCNFEWHNVVPVVMPEWGHQANAVRAALELVRSPLILFAEHDTPITGPLDWEALCATVSEGAANVIQLYENTEIHPEHERVLLDREPWYWHGQPLRRTSAWWQRPHLASTEFYRGVLAEFFPAEARTMIEDRLYSPVFCDAEDGHWDRWKVWLYTPEGNTRRSGHLDSRGDEPKLPSEW